MKMKHIFVLCIGFLFLISCQKKANMVSDFEYTENEGKITITGYIGKSKDVVIPKKINNLSVTAIGNRAFIGLDEDIDQPKNNQLSSVYIPDGVTEIGHLAFYGNELSSAIIPDTVTIIGDGAFSLNKLTSIAIPKSVTSIGGGAFASNQLTSVTIPKSVTSIGMYAFINNQLTSVNIPKSIKEFTNAQFRRFPNDVFDEEVQIIME
jgi:hypothetical protein